MKVNRRAWGAVLVEVSKWPEKDWRDLVAARDKSPITDKAPVMRNWKKRAEQTPLNA